MIHSIMLLESPGKTIRLFIAEPGHKLAGNHPRHFRTEQSVGFHAHHCDLTLIPLFSQVWNWKVCRGCGPASYKIREFQYRSKIPHGEIGFKPLGWARLENVLCDPMEINQGYFMAAEEMHTIIVLSDWAAWLALEGRENPNHDNRVFSARDLSKQNFDHFYKPVDAQNLERLLRAVELI